MTTTATPHVSVNICKSSVDICLAENGHQRILMLTWDEAADLVRERGKLLKSSEVIKAYQKFYGRGRHG